MSNWDNTDEIYLAITVLLLWFVVNWRNKTSVNCTILLLFWFVLANATYRYGEIETEATILIALIHILLTCTYLYFNPHWLPIYILLSDILFILWSIVYTGPDPYTYKLVKNIIYCGEVLSVLGDSIWEFYRNNKNTRDKL